MTGVQTCALPICFFLGIFVRRARQRDAIVGMTVGLVTMALVVFARLAIAAAPVLAPVLHPVESVAWPWYVLIGTMVTVGSGTIAAFLPVRSSTPQRT